MNSLAALQIDPQSLWDFGWSLLSTWAPRLILALITLIIGWKLAGVLGRFLERAMDRKEVDATLRPFLVSLLTMMVRAGVVVSAVTTAGVEATSFAAILASMGLAIGLALSGTLQNFAGGVILLIIRPFRVGDVITAQGFTGKVAKIEIFQTVLVTGDNNTIHIPNGKLQNDSLINYSSLPQRRVDLSFGIGYAQNVEKAREVIQRVIDSSPKILSDPAPRVVVGALSANSVELTVRVWSATSDYWEVFYAMNEQVKEALDQAGIEIPHLPAGMTIVPLAAEEEG